MLLLLLIVVYIFLIGVLLTLFYPAEPVSRQQQAGSPGEYQHTCA